MKREFFYFVIGIVLSVNTNITAREKQYIDEFSSNSGKQEILDPNLAKANCHFFFSGAYGINDKDVNGAIGTLSDDDEGFSLSIGYNFNKYASLSLSLNDFGEIRTDAEDVKFRSNTLDLSFVGKLPLGNKCNVYGKIGYSKWVAQMDTNLLPLSFANYNRDDDSGYTPSIAVGIDYSTTDYTDLFVEWSYREFEPSFFGVSHDTEVTSILVGFKWAFFRKKREFDRWAKLSEMRRN